MMQETQGVVHVDDRSFDAWTSSQSLVFVDAYADWCAPCRMFAPVFEDAARRHDAAFLKLDVEANPATAQRHNIRSIPTLLVFRDGELVEQVAGAMPAATFERFVQRMEATA